jgi:SET domain
MDQVIIPRPPVAVAVVSRQGQHCVVATAPIKRGHVVLAIDGPTVATPTRYTVQVGEGQHVDAEARPDGGFPMWRFLNHACEPNTRLNGRSLVAVRDLAAGEEVSFDYDSTEWDMAAPFDCGCGSARCRRTVRGFRHLTDAQRGQLIAIAPHLQAELARAGREYAGARHRSS